MQSVIRDTHPCETPLHTHSETVNNPRGHRSEGQKEVNAVTTPASLSLMFDEAITDDLGFRGHESD